jgi:hypothetical protein
MWIGRAACPQDGTVAEHPGDDDEVPRCATGARLDRPHANGATLPPAVEAASGSAGRTESTSRCELVRRLSFAPKMRTAGGDGGVPCPHRFPSDRICVS